MLLINSPGGSPVQSGIINDEIGSGLRGKHPTIPLYVVVEDMCASGGYYVAAAADKIFVHSGQHRGLHRRSHLDGFGFQGLMKKVGVERRFSLQVANKGFLDPFLPEEPNQVEHARGMLAEIHQQFIDVVRKGRGKRLKETPDMFSGLFWSSAKSIELGRRVWHGSICA